MTHRKIYSILSPLLVVLAYGCSDSPQSGSTTEDTTDTEQGTTTDSPIPTTTEDPSSSSTEISDSDSDSTTETQPICGDGTVDPGEECDDSNDVDGDGCNSDCTLTGQQVWSVAINDVGNFIKEQTVSVAHDGEGNIFALVNRINLLNVTDNEFELYKFSPNGQQRTWTRRIAPENEDFVGVADSFVVNAAGNAFVHGTFYDSNVSADKGVWVAAYGPDSSLINEDTKFSVPTCTTIGGNSTCVETPIEAYQPGDITFDNEERVVVSGTVDLGPGFDGLQAALYVYNNFEESSVFCGRTFSLANSNLSVKGVAVSDGGDIFTVAEATAVSGPSELAIHKFTNNCANHTDIWSAPLRYEASGEAVAEAIAVATTGDIYVSATVFENNNIGDAYLFKFTDDGIFAWNYKNPGGFVAGQDASYADIGFDQFANIVTVGFDPRINNMITQRIDRTGKLLFTQAWESDEGSLSRGLALDYNRTTGAYFVGGTFLANTGTSDHVATLVRFQD